MTQLTGAQAIVETLKAYKTEIVFGYIGHATHEIANAMSKSGIKTINPATELGGAYMINAYNYLRGRSAAVGLWHTVGNLLLPPALQDATSSRIPAVHIGFNADGRLAHRDGLQQVPNVFTPVTLFDARVERVEMIGDVIHKAFQMANGYPAGASYIDVPFDVTADRGDIHIPTGWVAPRMRMSPSTQDIAATVQRIWASKRPIIIAGGGAVSSGAGPEIAELAELLGIPILTTTTAQGVVSEEHPLVLGTAGQAGWKSANDIFASADFALVLGSRLSDWGISQGFTAALPKEFVQVDLDYQRLGEVYFPTVPVIADVLDFTVALLHAVKAEGDVEVLRESRAEYLAEAAAKKAGWRELIDNHAKDDQFPASPWRVIGELRKIMGPDDILVSDIGNHTSWNLQGSVMRRPRRIVLSFGEAVLGSAVPLGIGAKLAEPESRVFVATGDGAIQYHLNELRVAAAEDLAIVFVVYNDGAYEANEQMMNLKFGQGAWTQFTNPDYVAICRAYGGDGERIASVEDIGPALQRGVDSGKAYLIDVPINPAVSWADNSATGPAWLSPGRDIPPVVVGYRAAGESADSA